MSDDKDRWFQSRDENFELKKKISDKEVLIKQQNTKLRKLESDLKNAQLRKDPQAQTRLIEELQEQVANLQKQNSELNQMTKQRKNSATSLRQPSSATKYLKSPNNRPKSAFAFQDTPDLPSPNYANLVSNAPQVSLQMQRLFSTVQAKEDASRTNSDRVPFSQLVQMKAATDATGVLPETPRDAVAALNALQNVSVEGSALLSIRTELRDKHVQIQQLTTQYERLRAQLEAERLVQRRALEQCEEFKDRLRIKESELLQLRQSLENSRAVETRVAALQTEIDDLRASNLQLEQHLASMINTTKLLDNDEKNRISNVVGHYAQNIETLNRQILDRDKKIDSLQDQIAQLNGKNSSAAMEVLAAQNAQASLTKQLAATTEHAKNLEMKLLLYSQDSGVDSEELMAALQMIRRKKEIGGGLDDGSTRKIQELELKHRELARDLEYSSELLLVQKRINEKQSTELQKNREEVSRLRTEIAIIKQAVVRPPQRSPEELALLKAQGIELKDDYFNLETPENMLTTLSLKHADQLSITSESMFSQSDLDVESQFAPSGKGELVALYISQSMLDPECSALKHPYDPLALPITFITVDFFHFDTTSSTLVGGWNPLYKFLSQFKVSINDTFLDYLAKDFINIELWAQRKELSAERVASAQIPLDSLLTRTDGRMMGTITMYQHENENDDHKRTDTIINRVGQVHFKLALLRPIVATHMQLQNVPIKQVLE